MHQVNLNDVAAQIAAEEGLLESVSVAQVKELLGILGRRCRTVSPAQAFDGYAAIVDRAGKTR